jgi:hypothetical protein
MPHRPAVDVVFQLLRATHQLDRVDLQQQARGANFVARGRIEYVSLTERQFGGMHVRRILVK